MTPDLVWFEYHCTESHDSADAQAWYRSHQLVRVLDREPTEDYPTTPDTYRVRWADGFEWSVWADELCFNGPSDFYRPDPPRLDAGSSLR